MAYLLTAYLRKDSNSSLAQEIIPRRSSILPQRSPHLCVVFLVRLFAFPIAHSPSRFAFSIFRCPFCVFHSSFAISYFHFLFAFSISRSLFCISPGILLAIVNALQVSENKPACCSTESRLGSYWGSAVMPTWVGSWSGPRRRPRSHWYG